tara:strand:- start:3970 stop:4329 length:360 start_codon:yes stop_codon:yes gene_type:complete
MNLNYFTLSEFDSPDLPNSGVNMDRDFIAKLEIAREYAGTPFRITSGYRTAERNKQVGGVPDSAHTKGHAADIACSSGKDRCIIIKALLDAGFNRIGVANSFIHVDNDPSKVSDVIWTY